MGDEGEKNLFDEDAVTEHHLNNVTDAVLRRWSRLGRPPTAGELLKAGDVQEDLHDLSTSLCFAENDAISRERELQAEIQRISDEEARYRAHLPSGPWGDAARRESERKQNNMIKATVALRRIGLGLVGSPKLQGDHDPMPMPADMDDVAVVKLGRQAKKGQKSAR